MLIVITKDPKIVDFISTTKSGAAAWGTVHLLNPAHGQDQAHAQLIGLLNTARSGDPLCIVGHGNDHEVGGKGNANDPWGWTAKDMALLLNTELNNRPSLILFEVCSDEALEEATKESNQVGKMPVEGFATNLQAAFRKTGVADRLNGLTVYSYNRHTATTHTLPHPDAVAKSRELQPSVL
ncbi:hypothetical protein [Catellatospora vulcania]|uniref:hypothetical protein n=1 Tax=Catellatospora vulcania TaxID=1460450 RepID=UPI0012D3EF6A|nr:hypothetical protein [Catellatospora vulcania]